LFIFILSTCQFRGVSIIILKYKIANAHRVGVSSMLGCIICNMRILYLLLLSIIISCTSTTEDQLDFDYSILESNPLTKQYKRNNITSFLKYQTYNNDSALIKFSFDSVILNSFGNLVESYSFFDDTVFVTYGLKSRPVKYTYMSKLEQGTFECQYIIIEKDRVVKQKWMEVYDGSSIESSNRIYQLDSNMNKVLAEYMISENDTVVYIKFDYKDTLLLTKELFYKYQKFTRTEYIYDSLNNLIEIREFYEGLLSSIDYISNETGLIDSTIEGNNYSEIYYYDYFKKTP